MRAAKAGLKSFEIEEMSPYQVGIDIRGYEGRFMDAWETTRAICFNVAKFGNSDPKKFPKTISKFFPLPWDKEGTTINKHEEILSSHERMVKRREELERKFLNEQWQQKKVS